eukprot:TRINITY_DN847_c0_g1_i1.p2 TRINITY_DN847_c0_g1~~TRINITY_DN847_c0_g1_i1.p2  ORF type:complete len:234 (+),score=70.48 TRINITY_DN847_c0_g1_i1:41-703(+)
MFLSPFAAAKINFAAYGAAAFGSGLVSGYALSNQKKKSPTEQVIDEANSTDGPMFRMVVDVLGDEVLMQKVTERDSFKELMAVAECITDDDEEKANSRSLLTDGTPTEGSVGRTPVDAVDHTPAEEDAKPEPAAIESLFLKCSNCGLVNEYCASGHAGNTPGTDRRQQQVLQGVWMVVIALAVAVSLVGAGKVKAGHKLAAFVWEVALSPKFLARVIKKA